MTDGGDVAQRQGGGDGAVAAPPTTDGPAGRAGASPDPLGGRRSRLDSRSTWLLVVCCVAQFMVILDLSIVNVALPSIQSSLGFSSPELQWVVDAYAITFAGFLMLGGRAADHFGQRRMFVVALVLFALDLAGRRRSRPSQRDADRRARGAGPRGALMAASLAGDHHLVVPARARSCTARSALWAAMNGARRRRRRAARRRSSPRSSAGAGCC